MHFELPEARSNALIIGEELLSNAYGKKHKLDKMIAIIGRVVSPQLQCSSMSETHSCTAQCGLSNKADLVDPRNLQIESILSGSIKTVNLLYRQVIIGHV